ncbi:nicotinamide N-methyltransferase-like [Engystomops pustulosus]|uniref:nicotinamide N-methyltransferase-like n=1 Tax=Engystomops pustulosus TaxID=76066 RepID=UPI003AFA77C4
MGTQQTYIDEFNPKDYLQTSYVAGNGLLYGEWTDFALCHLYETFTKIVVKVTHPFTFSYFTKKRRHVGDTLLDFGTGSSIYHLLSACEVFDKIIASDLLDQNRAEFQLQDCEKKSKKLRSKVKEVLKCDVLKRNPYAPAVVPPADCLLACLCLETPCKDIGGALNATFYHAGKKRFSAMTTRKEEVEKAFKEAGYVIEKVVYAPCADKSRMDVTYYDGKYFIHARKPNCIAF